MNGVPFSPLTSEELLERARAVRALIGFRVENVVECGGVFEDYDLDRLRELGAASLAYGSAYDARKGVTA